MKETSDVNAFEKLGMLRDGLKVILTGYKTVTPAILAELGHMGFQVSRKSNHYVLITHTGFFSDRYPDRTLVFVLSKTSSDRRAGLNLVSIICRTIKMYL